MDEGSVGKGRARRKLATDRICTLIWFDCSENETEVRMATKAMNESWRRVRDQIKSIWSDADFDDKEMKRARGEMDKIIGLIHDKTGESPEEIRRKMSAII
jgi:hypothetical protein